MCKLHLNVKEFFFNICENVFDTLSHKDEFFLTGPQGNSIRAREQKLFKIVPGIRNLEKYWTRIQIRIKSMRIRNPAPLFQEFVTDKSIHLPDWRAFSYD